MFVEWMEVVLLPWLLIFSGGHYLGVVGTGLTQRILQMLVYSDVTLDKSLSLVAPPFPGSYVGGPGIK